MNIKKLAAVVLSFGLIIPRVAYAEGEHGSAPSVNYEEVMEQFARPFGDPSGLSVYSRGNVKGKKRDVYVLNLPDESGAEVAKRVRDICYDHLGTNPKNSTRKESANVVVKCASGAAGELAVAAAGIASTDIPIEIKLPLVIVCGGCSCCCGCLACCAKCTSCGIENKNRDIKKLKEILDKLINEGVFLNSNVLIVAFDKRDGCCCRKGVYVGFKHIKSLNEAIAPVIRNENYFHNIKFGFEDVDMEILN